MKAQIKTPEEKAARRRRRKQEHIAAVLRGADVNMLLLLRNPQTNGGKHFDRRTPEDFAAWLVAAVERYANV